MGFTKNRIRSIDFKISQSSIELLAHEWKEHVKIIPPYPIDKFGGKGIVYTAGGITYVSCLWISINILRESGCILPVEIWHLGNEISLDIIKYFNKLNVQFRNFKEVCNVDKPGFHLKPLAILNSQFKEILYLDADNICFNNPSELFDMEGYQRTGTTFWPDYWFTDSKNPIWEIIGSDAYHLPEQESGQILINKETCWKELNLCMHFNQLGEYYYKFLYGDMDTFKFAWSALKTVYYMIEKSPSNCGTGLNDSFNGNTMIQYDDKNAVAFLHRNLLKWDITLLHERGWEGIKSFPNDNSLKEVYLQNVNGMMTVDFGGNVIYEETSPDIKNLENKCLDYLKIWRESYTYFKFYEYIHFIHKRNLQNSTQSIEV